MINREATIRWKGYDPNDLKSKSGKRVWDNCNRCGRGRWVAMQYSDRLCKHCAPSIALKGVPKPPRSKSHCEAISKAHTGVSRKPFSDATKAIMSENQMDNKNNMYGIRGGNDIVEHHYIYDHANPENHTVSITRSEHASHHAWMIRSGIEVPHINTGVDFNGSNTQ